MKRNPLKRIRYTPDEDLYSAVWDEPATFYRVLDGRELVRIVQSGEISGGLFATPDERKYGASWAGSLEGLVDWGRSWQKRRLGKDLFVAETEGYGRRFYHMEGLKSHEYFDTDECNTGLGCSMIVPVNGARFYRVLRSGKLVPFSWAEMFEYAEQHPLPPVALLSLGYDDSYSGTILGVSVFVGRDQYDKLWFVEDRNDRRFVAGGKTLKAAAESALLRISEEGPNPPGCVFLNPRPPGFERVAPNQVYRGRDGTFSVTKVGANYVYGFLQTYYSKSYYTFSAKDFVREFRP